MGTEKTSKKLFKMKLSNLFLATSAMACGTVSRPKPAYDLENFVTSEDVQFELLMDNVMGGISQATITKDEDEKILKFMVNSVWKTTVDLPFSKDSLEENLLATEVSESLPKLTIQKEYFTWFYPEEWAVE